MPNPKKGTLAHKRFIQNEGKRVFELGLGEDRCHYGNFQPVLRSLWLEGYRQAKKESEEQMK